MAALCCGENTPSPPCAIGRVAMNGLFQLQTPQYAVVLAYAATSVPIWNGIICNIPVSYTHLRAHETLRHL
eukprot:1186238-Ditylum_brightwellii.AAC.1